MSEEKNPLINITDLTGLKEPLIKLIDTVGGAVKIATQPWVTKRNAKADAEAIGILSNTLGNPYGEITYNNANFSITVKPNTIEEAAITRMVETEVRRQLNIDSVISKTANILETKETVSDIPVDRDWLSRYLNYIQDISNEDMQNIWAQILAGEIEQPSSFSLRTLDFIKSINSKEANIIQKVLKYALDDGESAFIYGGKNFLKCFDIPFLESFLLEELNIATDNLAKPIFSNESKVARIAHTNDYLVIKNNSSSVIDIPAMKLTTLGYEILKLTSQHSSKEDLLTLKTLFNDPNLQFSLLINGSIRDDDDGEKSIVCRYVESL